MKSNNPLIELRPNRAMADAIATAFGIQTYLEIINEVKSDEFDASVAFRKKFNGYYRIRQRSAEWYNRYYELMIEQKKEKKSFVEILNSLSSFGNIEASFASKLISAIDSENRFGINM